jgi:hypothetical protein
MSMRERSEKMKKQVAFRFSEETIKKLESIAENQNYQIKEFNNEMGFPSVTINKTIVLEHLIEREYERLQGEKKKEK